MGRLRSDAASLAWFSIGSVLIAISSGFGLIAAFRFNVPMVYANMGLFFLGYKLCQIALHETGPELLSPASVRERLQRLRVVDAIAIIGGGGFMGIGFTLMAQAVTGQTILLGLSAGINLGGGYILAHWGINNRLV
ncbi:MAG: hypothetical protein ABEI97_01115 [Candidatus Nanohaloarchaea archaeon]